MAKAFRYQHFRSLVADKVPSAEEIREGEIAVNLAAGKEKMFLKNTDNVVIKFITEEQVDAKIASGSSGPVDDKIEALSGAIDTNTSDITNLKSQTTELDSSKFGYASYDSESKRINFYSSISSNVLGYIDTTDFANGSTIDSVEVKTIQGVSYLVITFNAESGKQPIYLPISQIFDASKYYTKSEIDSKLESKVNVSVFEAEVQRATGAENTINGRIDNLVNGISCGDY
jgi:hypothetical protein